MTKTRSYNTTLQKETPFEKLEPLNDYLRQQFKVYWKTGTHLAVDETIVRFMGRASETVNIPTKPVPEGFKIWVLANAGYVLDWLYHAKGDRAGPVDLDDFWTEDLGFSKTQAVVLDLVKQQGIVDNFQHIIWLDNLFTFSRLLRQLKAEGFGAAGTVRTQKTVREIKEEKNGSDQQQKILPKEQNRGLHPLLTAIKLEYGIQLEWGTLYLISDEDVLQAAWKDQNIVLFMSTIFTGRETVIRNQRRPAKTATNAKTSREVFGDQSTKDLEIPAFIDDYNHYMGAADQADQLRSYYTALRRHNKTWKPLWHFLLDTTVTNCFKLYYHHPQAPATRSDRMEQKDFRIKLAIELFDHSERTTLPLSITPKPLTHYVIPDTASEHRHAVLSSKSQAYIVCRVAGRRPVVGSKKRKPLGELAHNINRTYRVKKRKAEVKKTKYGCLLCKLAICRKGSCWKEHLESSTVIQG